VNGGSVEIGRGGYSALFDKREAVRECLDGSGHTIAAGAAQFDEIFSRGDSD
jgi:hypothetical protein